MASKPISRWMVPLAIAVGLAVGLTVGREFGGDDLGLRILYGSAAAAAAALVLARVFALLSRRQAKDAEPRAAPDPARDNGSGSS